MKIIKTVFFICCVILAFSSLRVMAAEEKKEKEIKRTTDPNAPPGTEYILSGDSRTIVPKGMQVNKQGDLRVIEGTGEYAGRKFEDEETQVARLRSDIALLQEEVEKLKQELSEARKELEEISRNSLFSEDEE